MALSVSFQRSITYTTVVLRLSLVPRGVEEEFSVTFKRVCRSRTHLHRSPLCLNLLDSTSVILIPNSQCQQRRMRRHAQTLHSKHQRQRATRQTRTCHQRTSPCTALCVFVAFMQLARRMGKLAKRSPRMRREVAVSYNCSAREFMFGL